MFCATTIPPEIAALDPLAPVLAGARVESVSIDPDGRVRIEVEFGDEVEPFEKVHLPYLGVLT